MVAVFVLRVNREDTDRLAAPILTEATNEAGRVDLRDTGGKYVLVNFWESDNATSRIAAAEYDRFVRSHPDLPLRLVSVNTDTLSTLADEIVRHDSLDVATQYRLDNTRRGRKVPVYHAREGYSSYLLSPEGKVLATNPTVGSLPSLVK